MKLYHLILVGIAFILGWNVFLIHRDSEMFRAYDACASYTFHPDCPHHK